MADRPDFAAVMAPFEHAMARLSKAGIAIVDPCDLPSAEQLQDMRSSVFRTEFKAALNAFLVDHDHLCGIESLTALIRWNDAHPDSIPHGQSLLLAAESTNGPSAIHYIARIAPATSCSAGRPASMRRLQLRFTRGRDSHVLDAGATIAVIVGDR